MTYPGKNVPCVNCAAPDTARIGHLNRLLCEECYWLLKPIEGPLDLKASDFAYQTVRFVYATTSDGEHYVEWISNGHWAIKVARLSSNKVLWKAVLGGPGEFTKWSKKATAMEMPKSNLEIAISRSPEKLTRFVSQPNECSLRKNWVENDDVQIAFRAPTNEEAPPHHFLLRYARALRFVQCYTDADNPHAPAFDDPNDPEIVLMPCSL